VPWFLSPLVSSVAHRSGKEISALDNTFALIDEYICADLSIDPTLFPCSRTADHTFAGITPLRWERPFGRIAPEPTRHPDLARNDWGRSMSALRYYD
jgi:hypothetical protein